MYISLLGGFIPLEASVRKIQNHEKNLWQNFYYYYYFLKLYLEWDTFVSMANKNSRYEMKNKYTKVIIITTTMLWAIFKLPKTECFILLFVVFS